MICRLQCSCQNWRRAHLHPGRVHVHACAVVGVGPARVRNVCCRHRYRARHLGGADAARICGSGELTRSETCTLQPSSPYCASAGRAQTQPRRPASAVQAQMPLMDVWKGCLFSGYWIQGFLGLPPSTASSGAAPLL